MNSQKTVIFLTKFFSPEYGVSHFIRRTGIGLNSLGWKVIVMAEIIEGFPASNSIQLVELDSRHDSVLGFINDVSPSVVCAHTSPYFELLPEIEKFAPCFAFEHGDPTPELFEFDSRERRSIIEYKKRRVYPNISGVVTVSHFIRSEIGVPTAKVIYAGGDHVLDDRNLSVKIHRLHDSDSLIKVASMYRLGRAEAMYKSSDVIRKILEIPDLQLTLIGRGADEDADHYRKMGINVYNGVTDQQRNKILADADCYLSTSLWEGFNSPLVEAQFLGTPGLAFDVGAHPETTPHLLSDVGEFKKYLEKWRRIPSSLKKDGEISANYVQSCFQWSKTVSELDAYMNAILAKGKSRPHSQTRVRIMKERRAIGSNLNKLIRFYRVHGLIKTLIRSLEELLK